LQYLDHHFSFSDGRRKKTSFNWKIDLFLVSVGTRSFTPKLIEVHLSRWIKDDRVFFAFFRISSEIKDNKWSNILDDWMSHGGFTEFLFPPEKEGNFITHKMYLCLCRVHLFQLEMSKKHISIFLLCQLWKAKLPKDEKWKSLSGLTCNKKKII